MPLALLRHSVALLKDPLVDLFATAGGQGLMLRIDLAYLSIDIESDFKIVMCLFLILAYEIC